MKKAFVSLLSLGLITALTLSGCGSSENLSQSSDSETLEESETSGEEAGEFVGTWQDVVSQRCTMSITCDDGVNYEIVINWADSSTENNRWELTGTYDDEQEGIVYTGRMIYEDYSGNDVEETVLYEDGEGVIYISRNGKLFWEDGKEDIGADCVFEKIETDAPESSGTGTDTDETEEANAPVEFTPEWYRTYSYFKADEGESTVEMVWDDYNLSWVAVNGTSLFLLDMETYTEQDDGSYLYEDPDEGYSLVYYPSDNHVEIPIMELKDIKYYFSTDSEPVHYDTNYVSDTVRGNNLEVTVLLAYITTNSDYRIVKVLCDITNVTNENMTFISSNYFSLNNGGIINEGYDVDYDYQTLAPGTKFRTTIFFSFPANANGNRNSMTMTVDGIDVSLADKPYGNDEFSGTYYLDGGSNMYVIEKISGNIYSVVKFSSLPEIITGNVTLNSDNTFEFNGDQYTWDPAAGSIYSYSSFLGQTYYYYK